MSHNRNTVPALSSAWTVSSLNELNQAIGDVNRTGTPNNTITLKPADGILVLDGDIAALNNSAVTVVVKGADSAVVVNGAGQYSGFICLSGTLILENVTVSDTNHSGAAGCLGAGGGIFIGSNATGSSAGTIELRSVSITDSCAAGGSTNSISTGGSGNVGGQCGSGKGMVSTGLSGGNGTAGSSAESISATNRMGNSAAGDFGIVGSPGGGGGWGGGGGGGTGNGNGDAGGGGNPGTSGSFGGYGAGGGAGGGGGGAGGGGGGGVGFYGSGNGGSGGAGGSGAGAGPAGFGGGAGFGASSGNAGQGQNGGTGGTGGDGGNGASFGGGAGLGGGIFVMNQAKVYIIGSGQISSNSVQGGTSADNNAATASGAGIFCQGSGILNFQIQGNNQFTINDVIADEAGTVRAGLASPTANETGSDGYTTGGGTQSWGLATSDGGTLTLAAANLLTGMITIGQGVLDIADGNALQYASGVAFDQGTLRYSVADPMDYSGVISGSSNAIRIDPNGHSIRFAKTLSSSNLSGIHVDDSSSGASGALTLAGIHAFSGDIHVNAGGLDLSSYSNNDNTDASLYVGSSQGTSASLTFQPTLPTNLSVDQFIVSGPVTLNVSNNGTIVTSGGVQVTGKVTINLPSGCPLPVTIASSPVDFTVDPSDFIVPPGSQVSVIEANSLYVLQLVTG